MSVLIPEQAYKLIDKLCAAYTQEELSSVQDKLDDIRDLIRGDDAAFRDYDLQAALTTPAANAYNAAALAARYRMIVGGFWAALNGFAATARSVDPYIVDLDSFLRYYNYYQEERDDDGNAKWECLAPPDWYLVFYALTRQYPSPKTVAYEIKKGTVYRGTTYADGLRERIHGSPSTAGGNVDRTKYAGGRAYVYWEGATNAGGGAYTITVDGKDENGDVAQWTYSSTNIPASSSARVLNAGDEKLITECSEISFTGDITGGTFWAEARTLRTNPPT